MIDALEIRKEEAEVQLAITIVQKEERQKQSYNRFKDLQERFSRGFEYSVMREKASAAVTCRVSYIPFEARIDRTAFELIVRETKPQNIIIINSNAKRAQKVQNFIDQQGLKIKLHYDTQQAQQLSFKTHSAVKQVFLDDNLYLTLPVHQVNNKRYEVSRIRAALDMGSLDTLVLHPSHELDPSYSRPSLFLRGKDYRIHDLQEYLRHNGLQSVLVEGRLTVVVGSSGNRENQVTVYFDGEGQIRIEGRLSREYFVVRGLIYRHFGRI
ncbi:hypothetical protein FGO68_gene9135 [Halteria grandinella]|uniref:Cleavage and polyadenylation specificity factor subunit 2 n=1 Tax=Halteria grandinella TaxID=5974 RepID=A0A8J8SW06_HALGN|nr:hypothetical protein FGO68_gene9135 [Halteria grandinella]